MKISHIVHYNEERIRVDFAYDATKTALLRKIAGARWSKTLKAWHVPYTKEAFEQLKTLFPDVYYETPLKELVSTEIPKAIIDTKAESKPNNSTTSENAIQPKIIKHKIKNEIEIDVTSRNIYIKMPKNEADIQFLRSFKYFQWDTKNFCWVIANYGKNAEKILAYFEQRQPNVTVQENYIEKTITAADIEFLPGDFRIINSQGKTLYVYCAYNHELNIKLKQIPYNKWNPRRYCWEIPYSEKFLNELKHLAGIFDLNLVYSEENKPKIKPRISRFDVENYRNCPVEYTNKLTELRYSKNTYDTYTGMFTEFINYYPELEPIDISDEQIIDFLRYLVSERSVSTSYQNQSINAIKFYYERVLRRQRKIYLIERPREEKYLPEVLSQQEVKELLNATENLKHKALLMTIYSAGLRISEAVHLKIKDIDSQRMQIRVEQAKGKKDRYTLLSQKTLEVLRTYVATYKPKVWLFEGADGDTYSRRTITEILRKSVEKAGILKHITVHTLRHSFATHLLESGTDIRYIQSLLGHENTKTTEIYTHITTKGFDQIVSPLDNLDI